MLREPGGHGVMVGISLGCHGGTFCLFPESLGNFDFPPCKGGGGLHQSGPSDSDAFRTAWVLAEAQLPMPGTETEAGRCW